MADLAKLRALHEAATPGPWEAKRRSRYWGVYSSTPTTDSLGRFKGSDAVARICADANAALASEAAANAALIVAAVNALPELLAEIERLRAIAEAVERADVWFVEWRSGDTMELGRTDGGGKRVRVLAIGEDG